jgi:large subunit ribosomal protein L9
MLRENLRHLGKVGDMVSVSPGYARNFLLPRGIAAPATSENRRVLARKRERQDAEEVAKNAELAARAAALGGLTLETTERSDETGHLYGSVNAARIAELLNEKGFEIGDESIRLEEAIKESGTHEIVLHLFGETTVNVTVEVTGEGENREASRAEILAEVDAAEEAEAAEAASELEEAAAEEPAEGSEDAE